MQMCQTINDWIWVTGIQMCLCYSFIFPACVELSTIRIWKSKTRKTFLIACSMYLELSEHWLQRKRVTLGKIKGPSTKHMCLHCAAATVPRPRVCFHLAEKSQHTMDNFINFLLLTQRAETSRKRISYRHCYKLTVWVCALSEALYLHTNTFTYHLWSISHSAFILIGDSTAAAIFHTNVVLLLSHALLSGNPLDCSPAGSSVHGVSQARMLERVAISFSGDLPNPGIELLSPALQVDSLPLSHQGSPLL